MSIENRMAAKKRAKQAKAKRTRRKIFAAIGICLIPIVICLIAYFIVIGQIEKKAANDRYLKEDGTIKAGEATKYITLPDYKSISVNVQDYIPTASTVQSTIDSLLSQNKEKVEKVGTPLSEDQKVYMTYTATIDDNPLTDMTDKASEVSLTSLKTSLGEDFYENVKKLNVGDSFDFEVTYASDFSNTDLAGQKVRFKGSISAVDVLPELTDSFVADKLSDYITDETFPKTVEGLKNFIGNNSYNSNVETFVEDWISSNTKVKSYPFFYTKNQYYVLDNMYKNYMNQMNSYYGSEIYKNAYELLGLTSEKDYKKKLKEQAKESTKVSLAYQAIAKENNITVDEAAVKAYVAEIGQEYDSAIKSFGYNYLAQQTLRDKAFHHVMSLVKENGDKTQMWKEDPVTEETTDETTPAAE